MLSTSIRRVVEVALVYQTRSIERSSMRFLFLIHGDTEAEAAMTPDERRAIVAEHIGYAAMLRERGAYVLGEALDGTAAVVRPDERPLVTDGPFAETKEAVGGFYVVECEGRDEALALAAKVPRSPGVAVEMLGIAEL
jgi:hypothetical protein